MGSLTTDSRSRRVAAGLLLAASLSGAPTAFGAEGGLGCEGDMAETPLCVEWSQALDARAKIEAVLADLAAVEQPPWPPADLAAANALFEEGLALFRDEYFGDAAAKFEPALATLQAIQRSFEAGLDAALTEARRQLAAEDFEASRTAFRRVLAWQPAHAAALTGVAHAEAGERIKGLATEALAHIAAGDTETARALLDGIASDFPGATLRQARRALADFDARTRRNGFITAGYAALDRQDWRAATAAFERALAIDAGSTAAQDGLAQARRGAADLALSALRQTLETALADESWKAAIDAVREIERIEPDAAELGSHLPELERLAALESRVDQALADPQRALARAMRDNTRALIAETADPSAVGERIHGKGLALQAQFDRWTAAVAVTIRSDNRTEILMRPGRKLGRFRTRNLEVYPGTYTLLARRKGFREKTLPLTVQPGSAPVVVELVCDERF